MYKAPFSLFLFITLALASFAFAQEGCFTAPSLKFSHPERSVAPARALVATAYITNNDAPSCPPKGISLSAQVQPQEGTAELEAFTQAGDWMVGAPRLEPAGTPSAPLKGWETRLATVRVTPPDYVTYGAELWLTATVQDDAKAVTAKLPIALEMQSDSGQFLPRSSAPSPGQENYGRGLVGIAVLVALAVLGLAYLEKFEKKVHPSSKLESKRHSHLR